MRLRFAALAAACLSCVVASDALAEECRAPTVTFQAPALLTGLAANGAGRPLRIVAVGSSSTQGVGASGPSRTYPAQLALALADRLPGTTVEVLNKGVGGEVVADNLRRLERDVLRQKPDLVIWQVGTNDALRGLPLDTVQAQLLDGIGRIREQGAALLLMDPQPVPSPRDEQAIAIMSAMIAKIAKATGTPLFSRHERMLGWISGGTLAVSTIYSKDGLHMTDASYRCLALDVADMLAPAGETVATAAAVVSATAAP
jgi:acyl-CoA thioesterase-1